MEEARFKIDGMHCDACVRRVSVALEKLPGLQVESVEVGSATVLYDPALLSKPQIAAAVERIGFSASSQAKDS